jgi:hypothetical protein
MCGNSGLFYNVSQNGVSGDWYWDVITPDHEIIARGLSPSRVEARAEAMRAGASYVVPSPSELAAVAWQIA